MTNTPITPEEAVKLLREALRDIAYAKSWIIQNEPMKLVSIALHALDATAHLVEPAQTGGSDE